jgi:hypothetical protein
MKSCHLDISELLNLKWKRMHDETRGLNNETGNRRTHEIGPLLTAHTNLNHLLYSMPVVFVFACGNKKIATAFRANTPSKHPQPTQNMNSPCRRTAHATTTRQMTVDQVEA